MSLKFQYDRWKGEVGDEHRWSAPYYKIKYIYQNKEWQQVQPNGDIFKDLDQVKAYCGAFGEDVQRTACWLDIYHWSLMNKTKLTEDIYQFISHHAVMIRQSIDKEIANISINQDMVNQLKQTIIENGTTLLYFIFGG